MNVIRFITYLCFTISYLVSGVIGAPIGQRDLSNQVISARSAHNEKSQGTPEDFNTKQRTISDAELIEELQRKLGNYNRQQPPNGKPVIVEASLKILNPPIIDSGENSLKVNIEIRQSWFDQRFLLNLARPVPLSHRYYNIIWNPSTIIINAESITQQNVYMQKGRIILDTKSGYVTQIYKVALKTHCLLDLSYYPYDRQVCAIQFGSEVYNSNSVQYRWASRSSSGNQKREAIEFSPAALTVSSEFKYEGYHASNASTGPGDTMGNSSTLELTLHLSRSAIFPLYSFIIPFSLIAVLGFLPPFLGPEALIGRITFGATTFIGSLGLLYRRPIGPTVILPYLTALDVYAGLNMLLAFGSLVESCIVGAIINKVRDNDGDQGNNKKPTNMRRGLERLDKEVDTIIHFDRPVCVQLGETRVKVSAIGRSERNYIQESERQVDQSEERVALMQKARKLDRAWIIVYAVALIGSVLMIHGYYMATTEISTDFTKVNRP